MFDELFMSNNVYFQNEKMDHKSIICTFILESWVEIV